LSGVDENAVKVDYFGRVNRTDKVATIKEWKRWSYYYEQMI
jgi:hypothetical protein